MSRVTVAGLAASVLTTTVLATAMSTALGLALLAAGAAPASAAPASLSGAARSSASAAALSSSKPKSASLSQPVAPTGKPPVLVTPAVSASSCPSGSGPSQQPDFNQTSLIQTVNRAPWAENALDFQQVWGLTKGDGVLVAVVDSGVDWAPQLAGKVTAIDLTNTGVEDCVGHGTAVAGIIAAADDLSSGNPFAGVAPDASILSVKVQNADGTTGSNTLANGIVDAAFYGAKVISVSIQTSVSTAPLAGAVQYAENQGAVVVAAAGNDTNGVGPFYPASNHGVLSVGALNPDGSLNKLSDLHSHVRVTAPGADITSTWPGSGYYDGWTGTSFATPFVSGVAALVRARFPSFTAQQVVSRIIATADGNTGPGTGAGMVNPLQAVAALSPGSPQDSALPRAVSVSRAVPPDPGTRNVAMEVSAGGVGGAVLLVLASLVISQARRRRWRPGPAARPGPVSAAPVSAASAAPGPGTGAAPADPGDVFDLGNPW